MQRLRFGGRPSATNARWLTDQLPVLSHANLYFDHPSFTPLDRTLHIDFVDEAAGPAARVAVELSPESARALIRSIESALKAAG